MKNKLEFKGTYNLLGVFKIMNIFLKCFKVELHFVDGVSCLNVRDSPLVV